ncbi:MAG: hypothetical protein DBY04_04095 [Clostridiales bacterium]|nr:MAG: hypothetical protein DBY04_04095 [Clostridiales bacterium]
MENSVETVENLHFPPQLTTCTIIIKEHRAKCNSFFGKKRIFFKFYSCFFDQIFTNEEARFGVAGDRI